MRRLTAALFALLVPALASGAGVDLGVGADIEAAMTVTERQPGMWTVEARNPGSVPVHGRFHLSVDRNNTTMFTAWSDMLTLQPGDAVSRVLSTPPPVSGRGAITFRYGAGATPPEHVDAAARPDASPLTISRVRAYPERVAVAVDAPSGREVFVTVHDGSTRIFAQQQALSDGTARVSVPAHPSLAGDVELTVTAHTAGRRYSHTVSRDVAVRTGVSRLVAEVGDMLAASPVFTWF